MATLNDVAKLANVSKMTVSRVINHPDKVTDDLKQLVYQAMREVDYHPNVAAKALVNNSTRIIKFCVLEDIDTTEPYYMNLMIGIARSLDEHQYSLQLVTRRNSEIGNCDGYIITGMRNTDFDWIGKLKKPNVIFGENRFGFDYVDIDNLAGTRKATNYAIEKKYKQIIFIGIDMSEAFEYAREAGYIEAVQQMKMEPEIFRFTNHSHMSESFVVQHWSKFKKNTCFVCASDRLAIGIERGIEKCGGNVPNDFGIIGFDGVFLNQIASPQLTTVKQPEIKMGSAVAEMMVQKIKQNNLSQGSIMFDPELNVAGSTRS
ncbi:LacI family transcriptional regulator [Pediococcus ethanolidurans]|uniref:LacI family DNA-binding transcriptional regulator n=1 Tax=Pediococcus ethanolidurans TaxID=319653 RepID=UPI0021A983F8|nr:LacI family DNA-binding transcriptional regulator [Pediococcus ethanolidurans]MCT4397289.1 LacI family transcriptional regulator [Pediococcus ethanolidurans]